MTHTFEFIANLHDGRTVHMHYKGKSSRLSKVRDCIHVDLLKVYGIPSTQVKELYLRPNKKKLL